MGEELSGKGPGKSGQNYVCRGIVQDYVLAGQPFEKHLQGYEIIALGAHKQWLAIGFSPVEKMPLKPLDYKFGHFLRFHYPPLGCPVQEGFQPFTPVSNRAGCVICHAQPLQKFQIMAVKASRLCVQVQARGFIIISFSSHGSIPPF
jgi:hypothetical protein